MSETDADWAEDYINPPHAGNGSEAPPKSGRDDNTPDYSKLFDAPDYSTFVKLPKTAEAREYEKRVKSLLKAGVLSSIGSGNLADAAAFLHYGPGFAAAAGDLAGADEHAAKALDILTAPANPYMMFLLTAAPLVAQLVRNHEPEISRINVNPATWKERRQQRKAERAARGDQPKFTLHLPFGRTITLGVRIKFTMFKNMIAGFKANTHDPAMLTYNVFTDPKLLRELHKQGVRFQKAPDEQG